MTGECVPLDRLFENKYRVLSPSRICPRPMEYNTFAMLCCATFDALTLKSLNLFDLCDLGTADFWPQTQPATIYLWVIRACIQMALVSFQFAFCKMFFMHLQRKLWMEWRLYMEPLANDLLNYFSCFGHFVSINQRDMSKIKIATGIVHSIVFSRNDKFFYCSFYDFCGRKSMPPKRKIYRWNVAMGVF